MLRVVGIGDNVCDKYLHQGLMYPGGQALNVAVFCKQMGQEAAFLGAFGDDPAGEHVSRTLAELGVETVRCRRLPGANGCAVVDLRDGDRVFVESNRGGVLREHPLELDEEDLAYLCDFDLLHTSNNSYIDDLLPQLADLPGLLSYDLSVAWEDEARMEQICPHVNFAFLSCPDMENEAIYTVLRRLKQQGAGMLIATRGARGAIVYDGVVFCDCPINPVKAVDTLGAGDSFAAGFLVKLIEKTKGRLPERGSAAMIDLIRTAADFGAARSAETCLVHGAFGFGTEIQ